jgi:hypothetical protein
MIMSSQKPSDLTRSDKSAKSNIRDLPPQQNGALGRPNDKGAQASSLMERVTLESTLEIDRLIGDLNKLRRRLEDEGNRVQRDVAGHSAFSQSVIQLTQIVSDSMAHVKADSSPPSVSQIPVNRSDRDPTDTETPIPTFLTALERELG